MTENQEVTDNKKNVFEAIDKNDVNTLKALLADKQDVNIFDENFMTPLQHAAYKGNKDMVQMLLDQVLLLRFFLIFAFTLFLHY